MDELATVLSQAGSVELKNRHWLLRVGVEDWLNPAYLVYLDRGCPLADEAYAYDLALAVTGASGFAGGVDQPASPPSVRCDITGAAGGAAFHSI